MSTEKLSPKLLVYVGNRMITGKQLSRGIAISSIYGKGLNKPVSKDRKIKQKAYALKLCKSFGMLSQLRG